MRANEEHMKVQLKQVDSRIDTIKDLSLLSIGISYGCFGLLSSGRPEFIPILGFIAVTIVSTVFLLFKIAALSPVRSGFYARGRAFEATLVVVGSWLIVTIMFTCFIPVVMLFTFDEVRAHGILGFISGIILGLVIKLYERAHIGTRFLSIVSVDEDKTEGYPWRLPFPSMYVIGALVTFAVSLIFIASNHSIPIENAEQMVYGGVATLLSLVFVLCVQTSLEPVQYVSGIGDVLFGLASLGAIMSLTISFVGAIISIGSSIMLLVYGFRSPPDVDMVQERYKVKFDEEDKLAEQFYKDHGTFMAFTFGIEIALIIGIAFGFAIYCYSSDLLFMLLFMAELFFVAFLRFACKSWYIHKRKRKTNST